jgi:eukaryotic-like serine/threonine-protein kinase
MAATFLCLDQSWFERLKAGKVSEAEIDEAAKHLEHCPACAAWAQTLEEYNAISLAARSGARYGDLETEPIVLDLIRRLKELNSVDTGTAGNTPFSSEEAPESSLSILLAPAHGPHELGRLGIYRVLSVLGKGGMGLVLEAEDTLLKRPVALKVILPHLLQQQEARERFQREARAVAALQSDHIIPIYQVGEERRVPYLAMPLLHGETLESRMRRVGKLPVSEVLNIGRQIALGLAVAHEHGLIHRDVKPSNIWLESQRPTSSSSEDEKSRVRVKLLDFGLARDASSDDTRLTSSGTILGTPAYMAPEQIDSQPLDGRCDLFSLGCVLYQMSTGEMAFQGNTPMGIMRSLSMHTPTAPRILNAEVPLGLSDLIQELLSKDPSKRPGTAAGVSVRLANIERRLATSPAPGRIGVGPLLAIAACVLLLLGSVGYFYGGQIIRVATNKGELVVDVKDPTIMIKVVQNGLLVEDKTSKRTFTLTAGTGQIEVMEKDGIKLATKRFELTRGGITTVTVTLEELAEARKPKTEDKLSPKTSGPTPSDADRLAAVWVLSIGGSIRIHEDGKELPIASPDKLPIGAIALTHVDLRTNRKVTDAGLACFKNCRNLTSLRLGLTQVSDDALANFKDCKNLLTLDLSANLKMTDAGLVHFKDCKSLIQLELLATKISDTGLANFKGCKDLVWLNLQNTSVSDIGLSCFRDCKKLRVLDLVQTQVSNAGLSHFEGCNNLVSLNLSHNPNVSDAGLAHFKGSVELARVLLHGTQVGDTELEFCKNWMALTELGLSETQVNDAGLANLAGLTSLQSLDLRGARATAMGVAALQRNLPKCKIVWQNK